MKFKNKIEDFEKINYIETGILYGLDIETANLIQKYTKQINSSLITNERTEHTIIPIIRYIITHIVIPEEQGFFLHNNKNLVNTFLEEISVDDIVIKLNKMNDEFLPISKSYLKNIDIEAELSVLFCNDYIQGLINKLG